jgi:hypothetical protein
MEKTGTVLGRPSAQGSCLAAQGGLAILCSMGACPVQSLHIERARRHYDRRQERAPVYLLRWPEHQDGMG